MEASKKILCVFVDCDWGRKNNDLSTKFNVRGFPTVVFLDPGPLSDFAQFDVANVRGVYLEGDVIADDGRLTDADFVFLSRIRVLP